MAAGARVLTRRDLNRALLARQFLLERTPLPLPRVLEGMAGLQAQYAPSMYIGLWSRMAAFRRDQLDRALDRRRVVQGTLMRSTIHLVSARDYWPLVLAVRSSRRRWCVQAHKIPAEEFEAAAERLRRRLAGATLHRSEVTEIVGRSVTNGVRLWVDLVRVPPSGTWARRRADLYAAAEDWLGPPKVDVPTATEHLVRRYLGGFGPATRDEVAGWAGLPVSEVAALLERLPLRRFRAEDGAELFDLLRAPLPPATTEAPVRFLPVWDATLLVHARRAGILREEHRPLIFTSKNPHSVNTFLVDGVVAGTWRYENGRVQVAPYESLGPRAAGQVAEEAEGLARLHQ
ncbi:MAG: winged helix DNA-binding domain-containing protein [Actinomycetota bacterium]|nr:winged helix DNA-binding domain-containing protein [Actinomycetota bacterium]